MYLFLFFSYTHFFFVYAPLLINSFLVLLCIPISVYQTSSVQSQRFFSAFRALALHSVRSARRSLARESATCCRSSSSHQSIDSGLGYWLIWSTHWRRFAVRRRLVEAEGPRTIGRHAVDGQRLLLLLLQQLHLLWFQFQFPPFQTPAMECEQPEVVGGSAPLCRICITTHQQQNNTTTAATANLPMIPIFGEDALWQKITTLANVKVSGNRWKRGQLKWGLTVKRGAIQTPRKPDGRASKQVTKKKRVNRRSRVADFPYSGHTQKKILLRIERIYSIATYC